MRNAPEDCGPDTINALVDFGTMPDQRENEINLAELDVGYSVCHCASTDCRFEARDLKSFDNEPGSTWHLVGKGPHKRAALNDLLQKIKEARVYARMVSA